MLLQKYWPLFEKIKREQDRIALLTEAIEIAGNAPGAQNILREKLRLHMEDVRQLDAEFAKLVFEEVV